MKNDKLKGWPRGPFYGFGAAGIGLGTTVQTLTGDWYWSPVILAISIALGALVSWRIGRSRAGRPEGPGPDGGSK